MLLSLIRDHWKWIGTGVIVVTSVPITLTKVPVWVVYGNVTTATKSADAPQPNSKELLPSLTLTIRCEPAGVDKFCNMDLQEILFPVADEPRLSLPASVKQNYESFEAGIDGYERRIKGLRFLRPLSGGDIVRIEVPIKGRVDEVDIVVRGPSKRIALGKNADFNCANAKPVENGPLTDVARAYGPKEISTFACHQIMGWRERFDAVLGIVSAHI